MKHTNPLITLALVAITSVNGLKNPCPPNGTSCRSNEGMKQSGDPGFPCWYNDGYGNWYCAALGPEGQCPYGYEDVSKCNPDPYGGPKKNCPPPDKGETQCYGPTGPAGTFADPGRLTCWRFVNSFYTCTFPLPPFGNCPPGSFNIKECPINPKPPVCPDRNRPATSCRGMDGQRYSFSRPGTNVCWSVGGDGSFNCRPYTAGGNSCSSNEIDVTTCPIQDSFCPPPNAPNTECIGPNGPAGTFRRPNGYTCWSNVGRSYACNMPQNDGTCGRGEVNVEDCPTSGGYGYNG
ncbi:hypothetical protein K502DRAFT_359302 [Neoconidiobolus thromboides FSU 785]|nr:hypothetical protein K502DRAFT_359302 [Neoconidiobolus thromboides FSU 785]